MSTAEKTQTKIKLGKPPQFCNVLYNNDKSTLEFIIILLMDVFNYNKATALEKCNEIHNGDKGIIFINSKEVCDYKHVFIKNYCIQFSDQHLRYEVAPYKKEK
jgi:ATP-dependent Clp protease adaptor protein ClpS